MPLLHSFLVYRAGTMSVKVSWAEPNWSVLMKNEHADKDEAETWDIRVELVRYRKVDFHHDGRIALPDAVVNFVFPQVREYVGKRLREEAPICHGSHTSGCKILSWSEKESSRYTLFEGAIELNKNRYFSDDRHYE